MCDSICCPWLSSLSSAEGVNPMQPAIGFFLFLTSIISYNINMKEDNINMKIILIIKLMSLDKIKNKHQKSVDAYSKNTILNSLIKHKLENQMQVVKENVATIIKKQKQQETPKGQSMIKIRRQKSFSITPQKIQQSLSYNPMSRLVKATQQFVSQRQNQSHIIPDEILSSVNSARNQPQNLSIKIKKSDKYRYESISSRQQMKNLQESVRTKTVKEFSQDIWLPSQPQTVNLIQNKRQQTQEKSYMQKSSSIRDFIVMEESKFSEKLFGKTYTKKQLMTQPLIVRRPSTGEGKYKTVMYESNKYHKQDYKSLEQWLQKTIVKVGQQSSVSVQQRLNMFYSVYMSGWKQIIRLTYIQSAEKGLLIQKLFYSMLRLFTGIIREQHDMTKSFYTQSQKQLKQINKMLQYRMQKLQHRYESMLQQFNDLKQYNHKLALGFISYEKVNKQLSSQLQQVTNLKNNIQKHGKSISNAYYKSLQNLLQKGSIESQQNPNDQFKTYYMINKDNKPIILGRFKSNRYDHGQAQEKRYGQKIKNIQNELNSYWSKKEDDLELKLLINSTLINVRFKDVAVGEDEQQQQVQYQSTAMQFPDSGQNPFAVMLNQQKHELMEKFEQERKNYELRKLNYESTINKWKTNSQQLNEKLKSSQQTNLKLNQQYRKLKQNADEIQAIIETVNGQKFQLVSQIDSLNNQISQLQTALQSKTKELSDFMKEYTTFEAKINLQKDNNKMLVRNNIQLKEKVQKANIKYQNIIRQIKAVSPWLQKFMEEVDRKSNSQDLQDINMDLFQNVSKKIEEHLGQFVQKDSSLFMTKLK